MRKIFLLVLAICSFPGAFAQAYSVLADSASIREWFEDGIRTIKADSSLERVTPYAGENFSIIFYHENFSPKDSRYYEFATPEQWAAGSTYPLVDREDKSTGFIYPHLSGYCYLAERYIPADKEYKRTLIKALVVVGKLNEVILPENKQGYDISICDKKDKPGLNAELFGIDEMASGEEDEVKYVFFSPEVASAKKCKITVTEKIGNIAAGEWADRRVIYNSAGESDEDEMSRRLMISEDFMEDDEYAVDDEGVKVRPSVDWVNVRIESVPKNCPFYIIPKRKYDAHEAVFKNISKCRRNLDDEMIDFLDNNFLCEKGHTNIEIPTEEKTCYVLIRHGRHASVLKMYQPNKTLPSTARIFFDFEKDRRP